MTQPQTAEVTCQQCGGSFAKRTAEIKRSKALNRPHFCSLRCFGLANRSKMPTSTYDIQRHARNRADEFTGFREHLRRCRQHQQAVTVTLHELKEQWETQRGVCPYTGLALRQPSYTHRNDALLTASLDRIDASKGDVPGNIQFVSMTLNYAKNTLTHEQMVDLCRIIAAHWATK